MKHKIEIIGRYISTKQFSRFLIISAIVNGEERFSQKKAYTKGEFMQLLAPMWKIFCRNGYKKTKVILIIESEDENRTADN